MNWATVHRYLDACVSPTVVEPEARRRLRFLSGGAIVGLSVALCSTASTVFVFQLPLAAIIVATFGIGLVALLAGIRAGVSPQFLGLAALALIAAFLFAMALVTELQWQQLNWLVLLPLVALLLDGFEPDVARRSRFSLFAIASVSAIALGLAIVVCQRLGWSWALPESAVEQSTALGSAIDLTMFIVSVTGLLLVKQITLLRAEREVARLREMLAVCAWCRRLKDDDGAWILVEQYVARHQVTGLSNTICPTCAQRLGIDDVRMPV